MDSEQFARDMGYSREELEIFLARSNNVFVVEHALRLDRWVIVGEVIESHGCSCGLKVGDKIHMSPHGHLIADRSPSRICLQVFPPLAAAVAVYAERIISGLDPDPYLFRRVGCLDVGVRCGGWGHIAFDLYAIPA